LTRAAGSFAVAYTPVPSRSPDMPRACWSSGRHRAACHRAGWVLTRPEGECAPLWAIVNRRRPAGAERRERLGRHSRKLGHAGSSSWITGRHFSTDPWSGRAATVDMLCTASAGLCPASQSVSTPPLRWSSQSKEQVVSGERTRQWKGEPGAGRGTVDCGVQPCLGAAPDCARRP
jgi:hypothetical protein